MISAGGMQASNALIPGSAGSAPEFSYDALSVRELLKSLNPGRYGVGIGDKSMEGLRYKQSILAGEGDIAMQIDTLVKQFAESDNKEAFAKQMKEMFTDMKQDDSWRTGNYFNSDEVKAYNAGIDKLINSVSELVNTLQ
jgi:soluble cytochrome b562